MWDEYEYGKREILHDCASPEDYERMVQELLEYLQL